MICKCSIPPERIKELEGSAARVRRAMIAGMPTAKQAASNLQQAMLEISRVFRMELTRNGRTQEKAEVTHKTMTGHPLVTQDRGKAL